MQELFCFLNSYFWNVDLRWIALSVSLHLLKSHPHPFLSLEKLAFQILSQTQKS